MFPVRLPNNDWRPREYQKAAWLYLENGGKRLVLPCHRRWGKDELALNWTAVAAHERVAVYWHMLPQFKQGRRAIWNAVNAHTGLRRIDEAFPPAIRNRTVDDEMLIEFKNGSIWQVVGSDEYDALVGAGVAGLVISEWSLANPAAWAFLAPMLEENNGWAIFPYTARGRNHGYSLLQRAQNEPSWFATVQSVKETNVFSEAALEAARQDYITLYGSEDGDALFRQEYYCDFDAAVLGAFYGKEIGDAEAQGRIANIAVDRSVPVDTAWDLGFTDSTAIWFIQQVGRELHLIDYYEANNQGLDHYAKVLQDRGYLYGHHYFPHDVEHHELGTGKSRVTTLTSLKVKPVVVPLHEVNDGINATRLLFPRIWMDAKRCERGLEALRNYRREFDDKLKVYKPKPLHDWTSHGADALRCYAAGFKDSKLAEVRRERYKGKDKHGPSSAWAA